LKPQARQIWLRWPLPSELVRVQALLMAFEHVPMVATEQRQQQRTHTAKLRPKRNQAR
jgi:hypothetical protein